ncbi:MAG: site-specific DNA-methyltransferase [Christiangramia sp.]|uniref:DNA-methyltransferase n=1 Tax=Christiangramia sp. TaxID=1931228 RepID=UPI003241D094
MKVDRIINGDCLEVIKKLPDSSVDLIVADPPYNLKKNFGKKSVVWSDLEKWLEWSKEWINIAVKKLKPTGSIFIYGIHRYMCYIQVHLYDLGLKYRRQFIWHYENSFSGYQKVPSAQYEPLLWFSKSDDFTYHQIRVPYKSTQRLKNKIVKNGKVWQPNPKGKHAGDVWSFPILAGKRFENERVDHPTQKPLSISNRIVKHFSNENDVVLIPFAGSGSECVSCILNNRRFIGIEINDEYIPIIEKRIEEAKQPQDPDLFTESI